MMTRIVIMIMIMIPKLRVNSIHQNNSPPVSRLQKTNLSHEDSKIIVCMHQKKRKLEWETLKKAPKVMGLVVLR